MKRSTLGWLLFAVCCAIQIAVPASMILRHEGTLADGSVYRFRCAPVDPVDPFRGRYVALAFEQSRFEGSVPDGLDPGSTAYATLEQDTEGFAVISSLEETEPREGDYLKVRIEWSSDRSTQVIEHGLNAQSRRQRPWGPVAPSDQDVPLATVGPRSESIDGW